MVASLLAVVAAVAVTLSGGQVRWFLPGELRTGEVVRCVVGAHAVTARVPPAPAAAAGGIDAWRAGATLRIDRRSSGATQVACGTAVEPRTARPPYVIGQNGVGLIRGPNRPAALARLYGPRAGWPRLGLRVVLAPDGAARRIDVTGSRWTSLSGVRVGDPLARLLWQVPGAKRLAPGTWLLARGRNGSRLLAFVGAAGVERLEALPR